MGRLSLHPSVRGLLASLTLAAGMYARTSHAEGGDPASECPRPADVVSGLGQILSAKPGDAWATEIVIRDQGATWEIEVRGHRSAYTDPARDCPERTRVATVFAALALEPLDTDQAGSRVPARPSRTPSSPPRARWAVELAPLFAFAPGTSGRTSAVGWGGQGRGSVSGEYLGLSVGAETTLFNELSVGRYGAGITRAAADLSARLSWRPGGLGLAAELGPYFALLRVRGTGLFENTTSTRMDTGARGALLARLDGPRVSPWLALQAEIGASRFDLTVKPSGSVGTAPRLWLGVALGAALDLGR
jgi:hypothetical protein